MTKPSVGILILKDDTVLLVRHEAGSGYNDHVYGLPSGRLQEDETEIQAAVRELEEETGLKTSIENLIEFPDNFYIAKLPNRKNPDEREIEYTWRVFLCNNHFGEIHPSTETTPEWVKIQQLDSYNLIVNVKNAIEGGLRFREHKEINKK